MAPAPFRPAALSTLVTSSGDRKQNVSQVLEPTMSSFDERGIHQHRFCECISGRCMMGIECEEEHKHDDFWAVGLV